MQPKISVIIPVYNGAATIREAIASVVHQTYPNVELVVMDGGSKDHTVQILEELQKTHSSILYVSEKDKGVYDAMNKGIGVATGDWIFFLGADDTLYDNEVLSDLFANNQVNTEGLDLLYGDVLLKDQQKIYGGPFDRWRILLKNVSHQAIFYKKSLFEQYGVYDLKYPILADYVFNLQLFGNKHIRMRHVNKTVCVFAEEGLSSTRRDTAFKKDRSMLIRRSYPFLYYIYGVGVVPFIDLFQKKILPKIRK